MSKITFFKDSLKKFSDNLDSETVYCILAALPLYFTWVPIYTWYSKTPLVRKISIFSAVNTGLFFIFLILAQLFSFLPFIGNVCSNLIHLISIIFYLSFSGFLIYSVRFKKTIEIPILTDWVSKLERFLAPMAQLDRVSDYGSEG
jgi:hypothetical protein